MKIIDIHSHLQDKAYDIDREEVFARMIGEGVGTIIVGTDRKMSEDAVSLAEKFDLYATVGQHPTDIPDEEFDYDFYKNLAQNEKVVAIGECGLDYFRIKNNAMPAGRQELRIKEKQKILFKKQIELAQEVGKPLMIHGRSSAGTQDAYEDILDILNSLFVIPNSNPKGNVHFFAGSLGIAQKFLKLGFTLSFTGVITFTHDYDEVIKNTPLDMLMVETDAPYVSPVPYRGKRNEPQYVVEVVKRMAEIKGESYEKVIEATTANAKRVFGLV